MTVAREVSKSVAGVIEQLELDGDLLMTADRLAAILDRVGSDPSGARPLAYELQRAGWLGRLRTRHVWEFLPAARGGAYGSGDRFIEFRAQRAVDPAWDGVLAMESAASALGFAQRVPEREVVAIAPAGRFPKAMEGEWRVVRLQLPEAALTTVNRLPAWNLEGLIMGIAARPSRYHDIPGLGQWLPENVGRVDVDRLAGLLGTVRPATRQRAAYLLGAAGNDVARSTLVRRYPPTQVAWLGPRVPDTASFDSETQVNDTLLHRYLTVGTGS